MFVLTLENKHRAVHAAQRHPEGIRIVTNRPAHEVLARLALATAIAADFDGTLTKSGSHWNQLDYMLDPEEQERAKERLDKYHGAMVGLSEDELHDLDRANIAHGFAVYARAKFGPDHFKRAGILSPAREGIRDLLARFEKRMVVSFGLGLSIEAFMTHHAIEVDRVIAGKVMFKDEDGSCVAEDLVITGNKGVRLGAVLDEHGLMAHQVLRVGDSWGDRNLFHRNALNVIMLPPNEPDPKVQTGRVEAIKKLWGVFPMLILADDSFTPLVGLVEHARKVVA